MSSFYYDLVLSGLTYVLLTYLTFTLMKRRKRQGNSDDNDGGVFLENGPKIDLPPGVVWPDGSGRPHLKKELEKDLY